MQDKIKTAKLMLQIIGWLNIGIGVIIIIIFIVSSLLLGMSGEENAEVAGIIIGSIGVIVSIVMIVFGVISLLAANGIKNRKNWAKIVGIIIAILSLPSIPVGTILGIFILLGLFSPEAKEWFNE